MSINVCDHVTGCFSACKTRGLAKTAMYFKTLSIFPKSKDIFGAVRSGSSESSIPSTDTAVIFNLIIRFIAVDMFCKIPLSKEKAPLKKKSLNIEYTGKYTSTLNQFIDGCSTFLSISSVTIFISDAFPCNSNACLLPFAPAANKILPILQACPMHQVDTSGLIYIIVPAVTLPPGLNKNYKFIVHIVYINTYHILNKNILPINIHIDCGFLIFKL
ncbi:hypothetical protein AGLY_011797 [Aphis glycines]|uniref:Uncharacterized protein n=1 Tax=Aphis glycines TaxID=307491 RepID=A0A6G0TBU5_APHGL|nr:hypothetical protein AGLY_011797 [Aphis glycines]